MEYIENIKTNQLHQCPKRSNGSTKGTVSRETLQTQQPDVLLQVKLLHQKFDKIAELLTEVIQQRKELEK